MYNVLIIILTVFALNVAAQSPAKVLKQAEKALGGAKALQAKRSVTMTGVFWQDDVGGAFLLETAKPNLYHVKFNRGAREYESGYNGRSGWVRDATSGVQSLTGKASLILQTKAMFRNSLWLNAKAEKLKITPAGQSSERERPTNNLLFTTPKGVTIKVYFDAANGLPLKDEIGDEITEYYDYKSVNGVMVPHRLILTAGTTTLIGELKKVEFDRSIAAGNFDFPRAANEPLPDVTKLLADLQANQDRIEQLLETYSYTRDVTSREVDKGGRLVDTESETQQMSFYKGYRIERTIAKNGKPLTANQQADEDKSVAKRVESIEKRIAKADQKETGETQPGQRSVSIAELLRASRLINPRRERFRGRDVIVFDFEPNPDYDFRNAKSMLKFFGKTAGVIWVDENDKQMVRVEAYLADDFTVGGGLVAKLKKGATFTAEQERFNDEIWLPSLMEINLSVRVLLVKGVAVNQSIRSYDYRKFQTEVKDANVNEVKKP